MGVAAKSILSEVESLLEDVTGAMQNVHGTSSPINDEYFVDGLNEQAISNTKVAYLFIFVQSLSFLINLVKKYIYINLMSQIRMFQCLSLQMSYFFVP